MVLKSFLAVSVLLLISACTAPSASLPPKFLGTWHGVADDRFAYHFDQNGRYTRLFVPTGAINDEGRYKVLGQDDPDSVYILTRETWHRPPRGNVIYDYKKLDLYKSPPSGQQTLRIHSGAYPGEWLSDPGWLHTSKDTHLRVIKINGNDSIYTSTSHYQQSD